MKNDGTALDAQKDRFYSLCPEPSDATVKFEKSPDLASRKANFIMFPLYELFFFNRRFWSQRNFLDDCFYPQNLQFIPQHFADLVFFSHRPQIMHPKFTNDLVLHGKKCKMIIFTQKKCTLVGWKKAKVLAKKPRSGITARAIGDTFAYHV